MTYQGHIENGAVVFDDPANLPEGVKVIVCLFDFSQDSGPDDENGPSLYERLAPAIGTAKGLPPDASRNVDHYLYGASKT
ncbi:MAG TPA: hypothetical protein PLI09_06660 [Candidatus Hydrogenedentes bacterium]|nr:hypothetical protein [Candidatus Hydrogenedentota bacterium]